jgi:hypothetical protein
VPQSMQGSAARTKSASSIADRLSNEAMARRIQRIRRQ